MSEEQRTAATLKACENVLKVAGQQREETLAQIAQSLSVMLGSAVALVDGMGNVVGYQIKTGALHRVLGYMAGLDHPVTVPLCRTQIVLNHESSPWPLEGQPAPGVALRHATKENGDCPHWCEACKAEEAARGVMASHEDDPLESQEFYEVCQQYRHAQDIVARPGQLTAAQAFDALKAWLRTRGVNGLRMLTGKEAAALSFQITEEFGNAPFSEWKLMQAVQRKFAEVNGLPEPAHAPGVPTLDGGQKP